MAPRLDQALVARGLAPSRARAQALIAGGYVTLDGVVERRPARAVAPAADVVVTGVDHPWVSRGGIKLAHALDHFEIDPTNLVALDLGASTGGFTQVLLTRGARRVYAVDVGHDQLAAPLALDPRVVVLERTNARSLTPALVPEPIDLITCDASFIGLQIILPAPLMLAAPAARLVSLIKPQFEVGPDQVGKGGVVRDPTLHQAVCDRIAAWIADQPGWRLDGIIPSPIEGGDGNREFLLAARRS